MNDSTFNVEKSMPQTLLSWFQAFLNLPFLSRIRRNHGLEHATLHILSQRNPGINLAGHSDIGGFWLLGDVEDEQVESAVHEALQRLRGGENHLAVHPNCGTNFVAAGTLAGVAAALAMLGSGKRLRDRLERIPLAASFATLALMLAQPLGLRLQEQVTTSGSPGNLQVTEIIASRRGRLNVHRIVTRG